MPYLIPVGGSNKVGIWGYIEAFREMMEQVIKKLLIPPQLNRSCNLPQGVLEDFDDIIMATGSGGTLCGLAIGNHLTGSRIK